MAEAAKAPTEVGMLLYPGCQTAMVHGMADLLSIAGDFSEKSGGPRLRVSQWENVDGAIRRVQDTHPGLPGEPAIVIAPGRLTGPVGPDEALPHVRWLLNLHARGAVLASTCGGAFLLASTGLLSGRPATTHWFFAEAFRERFPDVRLDPDRMVIEDGDIITAGGLMAWTDLGLRIVDRLLGPTVMVETGKFLLIEPSGREQKHFAGFAPRLDHGDEAILKVQHQLQAEAGRGLTVPQMAGVAGLEERTFLRRFKSATGLRPTEYAQRLKVAKARELLEFTRRTVDQIAWSIGYEDAAAFRRVFHKVVGLTASEYRSRFSVTRRAAAVA